MDVLRRNFERKARAETTLFGAHCVKECSEWKFLSLRRRPEPERRSERPSFISWAAPQMANPNRALELFALDRSSARGWRTRRDGKYKDKNRSPYVSYCDVFSRLNCLFSLYLKLFAVHRTVLADVMKSLFVFNGSANCRREQERKIIVCAPKPFPFG